jgi:hypothetical protein
MAGGKGLMYLHNNWVESAGGRKLMSAMGIRHGDFAGNYYLGDDSHRISSDRTLAGQLAATDRLSSHMAVVQQLQTGANVDFGSDKALVQQLDALRQDLLRFEGAGTNIFADDFPQKPYLDAQRRLVLWADLYRSEVDYTAVRRSNAGAFYRTLAADSLSYALRPAEATPQNFADWMPVGAKNLTPIANWETISVTIPQGSGRTAIGRGAIPGKALEIEVLDAAGAKLALRVGNIRTRGNPQGQENYTRARFPDGHQTALKPGQSLRYVTAWGGPLFLDYSGATAGTEVLLRVRGSVKYAHFDYSKQPRKAEVDEAVAALVRGDFGWQTAKFIGGEVQQTIALAKSAIGTQDPEVYVQERLRNLIFNSNHIANGFNNIALSSKQKAVCDELAWDCEGNLHRQPSSQHLVAWMALCGYLCSGQPIDSFAAVNPDWGWWHEVGHNTVPRYMTQTFTNAAGKGAGCGTECDNNILASASAMRLYDLTNGAEDINGWASDHRYLYNKIAEFRNQGLSGEALRQAMYNDLWVGTGQPHAAMRAVHFQIGFIYARSRLNQAQATSQDTLEFFGLVARGNRLVDNTWTEANKAQFGMGRFSDKKINNQDLFYVLSSRVIGRDMRKIFAMYGLPVSETALGSIADLGLPMQDEVFYALPNSGANMLKQGQWLDFSGAVPTYPY